MASIALPVPPRGATCPGLLKQLSDDNPNKPAFVFIDQHWNKTELSRKDVWDNSRKFAAILRRHGIEKGDVVCNTLLNSPERLITAFGTLVAGAISMNGQIMLADGEDLIYSCKMTQCKAMIVDPGQERGAMSILKRIQYTEDKNDQTLYTGLPVLKTVIYVNAGNYSNGDASYKRGLQCIQEEDDMYGNLEQQEDDIPFSFSTSGTTGFSKQVPHTHRSCLLIGRLMCTLYGIKSDQTRYFSDRALGWLGGFPGPYLVSGATRVLTDQAAGIPDPMGDHILKLLNEEDIECASLPTRDIELLMNLLDSGKMVKRRLRNISVTGMPISRRILKAFDVLTDAINIGYGSTEVGYTSIHHLEPGKSFEDFCVGVAPEGYQMKVVDEEYNEVQSREFGKVLIKSPTLTPGYLNEPEKTQQAFTQDGFFKVGDIAYKDDAGLLYVLGRHMDAIHKGAFIHYPGWIESRIMQCPGVEHVVVVGVPDPVNYQEICVCVIPSGKETLDEQRLQEYCKSLFLVDVNSEYTAMPKYFLFFEAFPYNNNGKLQRKILYLEACKLLNIN